MVLRIQDAREALGVSLSSTLQEGTGMITSPEEFVTLRMSDDPEVYGRAVHEAAPEEIWFAIIDQYPEMKQWVIHNKTVPISILERLVTDPDWRVRHAIAMKRKATPFILEQLVHDPDESIRFAVARNAKTPLTLLQELAHDPWERVAEKAKSRIEQIASR